eukprot:g2305.t1
MSGKGPTRQALQSQCVVAVSKVQNIRGYFHAARQLLLQGEQYYTEGELVQAYVYLKRFLSLALDLPAHKKYTRDIYYNDRAWIVRERERVFPVLESIAAQLDEIDAQRARMAATTAAAEAAAENKRKAAGGGGIGGTTLGYSLDDLPEAPTGHPSSSRSVGPYGPSEAAAAAAAATPPYPMGATMPPLYPGGLYAPSAPPPPSAGVGGYGGFGGAAAAAVGGTALQDAFRSLSLDQGVPAAGHYPTVPQPEVPKDKPSLHRGLSTFGAERKVVLPSTLVAEFEKIAKPNTDLPPYGIETCGILAGRLAHNILEMTTLIIPKQKGTSDSVETTDETELFNYMLPKKLITLGWIHTHPKQECFMSSVDVHTHCGYQLMLPEAVAVVYAPSDNRKRVGVFRLTKPEGMKLIQECELKGFHQHPGDIKIYEEVDLQWSPVAMNIVDLR